MSCCLIAGCHRNREWSDAYDVSVSKAGIIKAPTLTDVTTSNADFTSKVPTYTGNVVDNGNGTLTATGNFKVSYGTVADKTTEGNETVTLNLGSKSATGTISDTSLSDATISVDTSALTSTGQKLVYGGGATSTPAIMEDGTSTTSDLSTVLTYTVTLANAAAIAQNVTVNLSGTATAGADYTVQGLGSGSSTLGNTVTLYFKAGQTTASFTVDAKPEVNAEAFVFEGEESVIATIATPTSGNNYSGAGRTATGSILDGNPIALQQLDGDITLYYGLSKSSVLSGDYGDTVGSSTTPNDPLLMTNYNDTLNIGYYQNGVPTGSQGNFSSASDYGPASTFTEGQSNKLAVIDMGAGNDTLNIRGRLNAYTQIYLGEGNDTVKIDGQGLVSALTNGALLFAEQGDDNVTINNNILLGSGIYMGSGGDTLTVNGDVNGNSVIDLGSGNNLNSVGYLTTYQTGGYSLGNDNNIDLATDINTLTITGSINGSSVYGGAGIDNITINSGNIDGGNLSLGSNNDSINILGGYIQGNSSIDMGDGNDTLTVLGINNNSTVNMGTGNDTVNIISNFGVGIGSAALDMGSGNDTVNFAGSSMDGTINGGAGNDTFNFTGSNQNLNGIQQFETINLGNKSNELNISFNDVLNTNNKTVFITGGATDTVDFGNNGNPGRNTSGVQYVDQDLAFNNNDTFWVKGTSTQAGYDMYVYQGSFNTPNAEGYTIYIDTNIGTVI